MQKNEKGYCHYITANWLFADKAVDGICYVKLHLSTIARGRVACFYVCSHMATRYTELANVRRCDTILWQNESEERIDSTRGAASVTETDEGIK